LEQIQQELAVCREYAQQGYNLAHESFEKMQEALRNEREKLRETQRQQNQIKRLENDKQLSKQLGEIRNREQQTVSKVADNLRSLKEKMGEFTIVLYGRTMAGKSTLMEILRHGDGSSIGKGAQRTTLDVRAYHWNGLKIFDVPGTCSFGGEKDDNLALAAAEDADLALFLLTDDAPQPYEAERLGELKKLGKPVLGIVNVKQVLSPDSASAKRKLDIRQLQKKIGDKQRLQEIVEQFKEFSHGKGYDFEDIPFVYSHLQSAFFSQRENDAELYKLSNFEAVENFILEKVKQDGKFIRIKTFIDAVARPLQESIATLYAHSAESVITWMSYGDKIEQLDNWNKGFVERVQSRYNDFIQTLRNELNSKINYAVNNYYDDGEEASAYWNNAIVQMNLDERCKDFIVSVGESATEKMRALSDELVQDLKYSGVTFKAPKISLPDTSEDFIRTAGKLAILAAPFSLPFAIGGTIFSILFGKSRSTKIREAKEELREALEKSRDEIIANIEAGMLKVINENIHGEQIGGFRDTLDSMQDMFFNLAYAQNLVADTLNNHYYELNFSLLIRAAEYSKINPNEFKEVATYRIVGEEFLIINESNLSEINRRKLANLLGEPVTVLKVTDSEQRFSQEQEFVSKKILGYEFAFTKFVEDETNGDMFLIVLPRNRNFTAKQIQLTQQIFADPVVFLN